MQQRALMLNDRRVNGYTIYENAPIGFIMMFGGQIAPQGYILCDGRELSRRLYADLFNVIGTTYGKGDGLYTFNVPDFRDRAPQGASAKNPVGRKLEAGLPNITGEIATNDVYGAIQGYYPSGTGAYNVTRKSAASWSGSTASTFNLSFDASRSNAIYGTSETVQSPALTTVFYIKATKTKPEKDVAPKTEIIPTEEYVRDLVLKTTPVGELKYFPEKKFVYGYRYADGSVFLPEVYPDFFEFWKIHFEKECGYDNNGYPRLPDYSGRYIRGVEKHEQSLKKERESLPNIKGTVGGYGGGSEAFTRIGSQDTKTRGASVGESSGSVFSFDAGLSNSIYGRNKNKPNRVIVNNVNSYIYIKVI